MISSDPILSDLIWSHPISSDLHRSHLILSNLIRSYLISADLIWSHFIQSDLNWPHPILKIIAAKHSDIAAKYSGLAAKRNLAMESAKKDSSYSNGKGPTKQANIPSAKASTSGRGREGNNSHVTGSGKGNKCKKGILSYSHSKLFLIGSIKRRV